MSYIGATEIGKMFLGDVEIDKAYLGNELVFSGEPPAPKQYTITIYPSSYDTVNYSVYDIGTIANAYTSADSTTRDRINLTRGSRAVTYVYFKFDLSSIPANATIDEISLRAKGAVNTGQTSMIATKQFIVCRGTESVGQATSISTTATAYTLDVGSGWTGANINELTLKAYAVRGTGGVNSTYYFDMYGATLTITYTA